MMSTKEGSSVKENLEEVFGKIRFGRFELLEEPKEAHEDSQPSKTQPRFC